MNEESKKTKVKSTIVICWKVSFSSFCVSRATLKPALDKYIRYYHHIQAYVLLEKILIFLMKLQKF